MADLEGVDVSNATCSRCARPTTARGLCTKHYHELYRSGGVQPIDRTSHHRLTGVDAETLTATCSICGPVRVHARSGGRGFECYEKRRFDKRRSNKRNRKLNPIDPTDRRRWKYGLSRDEWVALVTAAEGRCGICDTDLGDDFHVDHCHETGIVRGLLCQRCNYALGWFDDSPPRVLAAYMYLKAHGKSDDDWQHRGA